jgi:hypothetical protein
MFSRIDNRCFSTLVLVISSVLANNGCSESNSATSPTSKSALTTVAENLTGSVTDPVGDTVILPVVRNGVSLTPVVSSPSDLVAATVQVSGGNLTATISFAPGTLSHSDTFACLMLDLDENAATGTESASGDVRLGYDYSICAVVPRGSTTAQVSRLGSGAAQSVGSAAVTFPSAAKASFTVPLTLLGGNNGRAAFKVSSMQWVDAPIVNTGTLDWMPDLGQPAGTLR